MLHENYFEHDNHLKGQARLPVLRSSKYADNCKPDSVKGTKLFIVLSMMKPIFLSSSSSGTLKDRTLLTAPNYAP